MARQKPLDLVIVETWLSAWNESDIFSDSAVHHLLSLVTDPFCYVVVTLGVGREPRSLAFWRLKRIVPSDPSVLRSEPNAYRWRWPPAPAMSVSPVAPVAPSVGQLWHQTGVRSETVPKLERVLRWDGTDWIVAGLAYDSVQIEMRGMQVCGFNEALAHAHWHAKWLDCEFIYTHDGSTWGNA
jgi:hypothetical protein